jgi:O-antigen/teichoic acid export membrane protein
VLVLTAAGLYVVLARLLGPSALVPTFNIPLLRRALGIGVGLHLASLAFYLNLRLDLLLVGALASDTQAGLYSLAVTLIEILYAGITAIAIGALEAQSQADAGAAVRYTMDFIRQNLALAVFLAGVAVAISYPFIVIVYGSDWKGSVLPFAILALAVTALAVENPAQGLLIRIAPPLWISAASVAAVLVNVGLNLALIPAIGIPGAALASLVSYWCAAALMLALLAKVSGVGPRRALAWPRSGDVLPVMLGRLTGRRDN